MHNIKRKKYKMVRADMAFVKVTFDKIVIIVVFFYFFIELVFCFFISYAVELLQYSKSV